MNSVIIPNYSFDGIGITVPGIPGTFGMFTGKVDISIVDACGEERELFQNWRIEANERGRADLLCAPTGWTHADGPGWMPGVTDRAYDVACILAGVKRTIMDILADDPRVIAFRRELAGDAKAEHGHLLHELV